MDSHWLSGKSERKRSKNEKNFAHLDKKNCHKEMSSRGISATKMSPEVNQGLDLSINPQTVRNRLQEHLLNTLGTRGNHSFQTVIKAWARNGLGITALGQLTIGNISCGQTRSRSSSLGHIDLFVCGERLMEH